MKNVSSIINNYISNIDDKIYNITYHNYCYYRIKNIVTSRNFTVDFYRALIVGCENNLFGSFLMYREKLIGLNFSKILRTLNSSKYGNFVSIGHRYCEFIMGDFIFTQYDGNIFSRVIWDKLYDE